MAANSFLPYGRQSIDQDDIAAVCEVLGSAWLTTGPQVDLFERSVAEFVGVPHGVAVTNGTSALHSAMYAVGIGCGDEVIVPAMTFAATANAIVYQGGRPVFADVDAETLLIDPASVERLISSKTRAIIAVDYAGQACNYAALRSIAKNNNLILIADACHSLGGRWQGQPCGSQADLSVFSFHPVKPLTTAEGGMVVTASKEWVQRMKRFRNHGITTDHRQRSESGDWTYEMVELGYNYRLSDLQCALGISQLKKLPAWILRRQELARSYDRSLAQLDEVKPLTTKPGNDHGYHLYVVKVSARDQVFQALRTEGIGCNIHYIPVYLHPYYREHFGTQKGDCPVAEQAYEQILSLPIYPEMTTADCDRVVSSLRQASRRI